MNCDFDDDNLDGCGGDDNGQDEHGGDDNGQDEHGGEIEPKYLSFQVLAHSWRVHQAFGGSLSTYCEIFLS